VRAPGPPPAGEGCEGRGLLGPAGIAPGGLPTPGAARIDPIAALGFG
jgi:hypothetical protein